MYKQINKHPWSARPSRFASRTVHCLPGGGAKRKEKLKVHNFKLMSYLQGRAPHRHLGGPAEHQHKTKIFHQHVYLKKRGLCMERGDVFSTGKEERKCFLKTPPCFLSSFIHTSLIVSAFSQADVVGADCTGARRA